MTTFFLIDAGSLSSAPTLIKGGPGSGNFGHAGRPGERGGSAPDGTGGGRRERRPKDDEAAPVGARKPTQAGTLPARRIRNRTPKDDQAFPVKPALGRGSGLGERILAKHKPSTLGQRQWDTIFKEAEQENEKDPLGNVASKVKKAGHGVGSIPKGHVLKHGKKNAKAVAEIAKEAPGKMDKEEITEVFKATGKTFTYLLNTAQFHGPGVGIIDPEHWGQLPGANLEDYLQFAMLNGGDALHYAGMVDALPRRRSPSKGLAHTLVAPGRLLDILAGDASGMLTTLRGE